MSINQYIVNLSESQLVFGSAFIFLGIITIILYRLKSRTIKQSLRWPATTGVIMHSYYFHSKSSRQSPSGPDIRYYFIVNGRKYESSRVSFIDEHPAHELLSRFKANDKVPVYYDPDNPKRSVLIPGGYLNFYVTLVVAIIPFFIIGIGVFVFG